MDLETALRSTDYHPAAADREQLLREQLAALRRDFYGHLMNLKRIAAWEESHAGEEMPLDAGVLGGIEGAKQQGQAALDQIESGIRTTLQALRELDPDAQ